MLKGLLLWEGPNVSSYGLPLLWVYVGSADFLNLPDLVAVWCWRFKVSEKGFPFRV